MRNFLSDCRFGFRSLGRTPAFTVVGIVTLALGIGANVGIFSLINAAMFKPLPVRDPERVARVGVGPVGSVAATSFDDYRAYRDRNRSFEALALHTDYGFHLRIGNVVKPVDGALVSANYFETLGVTAAVGRALQSSDEMAAGPAPVTISDKLWRDTFNRDPQIAGRAVWIGDKAATIVGVLPPTFVGVSPLVSADLWAIQNSLGPSDTPGNMVGRLRPTVGRDSAGREVTSIAAALAKESPNDRTGGRQVLAGSVVRARAFPDDAEMKGWAAFLMFLVGLILVVACSNVGNLMLARSAFRRRELSVRLALGASRWRVVRLLLAESLMLAAAGGCVATFIGITITRSIVSIQFLDVPPLASLNVDVDWRVAVFIAATSFTAAVFFGLLPALRTSAAQLNTGLTEAPSGGPSLSRMRSRFLALQFATSTILLITAGTFVHRSARIQGAEMGIDPAGVFIVSPNFAWDRKSSDAVAGLKLRFAERLRFAEGITSVTEAQYGPFLGLSLTSIQAETSDLRNTPLRVQSNRIAPGYFRTVGIPIVRGRDFAEEDRASGASVAVINETLARMLWSSEKAIGKRFRHTDTAGAFAPWVEVIGVVRDHKYGSLDEPPTPFAYVPLSRTPGTYLQLIRTTSSRSDAQAAVARVARALDPLAPAPDLRPIDAALQANRIATGLLSVFTGVLGLLALALAAVGTFGLVSYLTAQRSREIGICLALGAASSHIVSLLTRSVIRGAAAGIVSGGVLFLGLSRIMVELNVGRRTFDPVPLAAAVTLLAVVAYASSSMPARRAARGNPSAALRRD